MTDLPEPLTLPECDLRDFPWMPLDVVRLRDSELAALPDAEAFRCALLLFCAAWHQTPGGSLPQDDGALARLAGYGRDVRTFQKAKDQGALRGWVLCSDGRLYHPVVSEKANEAWQNKLAQKARTEAARKAKEAKRAAVTDAPQTPPGALPTEAVTASVTEIATRRVALVETEPVTADATSTVTGSNRQEQTRTEIRKKEPPIAPRAVAACHSRHASGAAERDFDAFWQQYPRKVGKDAARKAFDKAVKRSNCLQIMLALNRQRWPDDPQFIPHPATWLNQGRWQDDPGAAAPPRLSAYDQQMQQMADMLGVKPQAEPDLLAIEHVGGVQ